MSTERADSKTSWDEADSRGFLDTGRYFVPDREEQIATICAVLPSPAEASVLRVELCCGEGLLSAALLERFPEGRLLALDGSPAMLDAARRTVAEAAVGRFATGQRFSTGLFDLAARAWRRFPEPVHAFVSSLAIHHLDGAGKRELFADLAAALAPGGALVIADLVEPASPEARDAAAAAWDETVRRRSLEISGGLGPYEIFRDTRWNLYADPEPDPVDHPSPLFDQLRWLGEAGLVGADVFWMRAGHAIFGARKPRD